MIAASAAGHAWLPDGWATTATIASIPLWLVGIDLYWLNDVWRASSLRFKAVASTFFMTTILSVVAMAFAIPALLLEQRGQLVQATVANERVLNSRTDRLARGRNSDPYHAYTLTVGGGAVSPT